MVGHPELGNLVVSLGQRGPAEKGLRARVILALWAEVVFFVRSLRKGVQLTNGLSIILYRPIRNTPNA